MRVAVARLVTGTGGLQHGRLRLRAILAPSGVGDVNPPLDGVTIQLHDPAGALFCAVLEAGRWIETRPRNFSFDDPSGALARGLTRARVRVRRNGAVVVRVAGADIDLSAVQVGDLRLTIGLGSRCAAGTTRLHAKGRKGFVFP
jgi:hypothetical protein